MTIEVLEFIQEFRNPFFDFLFNFISFLGEDYTYITVLAILYYAYDKKLAEVVAFSLFTTASINALLKAIFMAPRPFTKYPDRVVNLRPETAGGYSFPSGHTQGFTTFTFSLFFKEKKKFLLIIALILSLLMAISRMYLGVHFLEDVTVSLVLGVLIAYGLVMLYNKTRESGKHIGVYIITLVVLSPFLLFLDYKSFFTSYGLLLGFTLAMWLEQTYVNFDVKVSIYKRIIRILLGIILMLIVQVGLKYVFELVFGETHLLNLIRYGLISFVGLGLFPMTFKYLRI
jgi:membrane-associated phospholipid phosphatase